MPNKEFKKRAGRLTNPLSEDHEEGELPRVDLPDWLRCIEGGSHEGPNWEWEGRRLSTYPQFSILTASGDLAPWTAPFRLDSRFLSQALKSPKPK